MNKIIIMVLMIFTLTSCGLFQEEIIEPTKVLTPEQIEQIEKEKFEAIVAAEDKKNAAIIQEKKQHEIDQINKLYEEKRKNMTIDEIKKEEELLNLNKMFITPIEK